MDFTQAEPARGSDPRALSVHGRADLHRLPQGHRARAARHDRRRARLDGEPRPERRHAPDQRLSEAGTPGTASRFSIMPWGRRGGAPPAASANDDLHPPVLRLAHAGAGRHQEMRLAEALDRDRIAWHAVPSRVRRRRLGRGAPIGAGCSRRAGCVGVAVHLDPRVPAPASSSPRASAHDLPGAIGQVCAVPVEEHEIGAGRLGAGAAAATGAAAGAGGATLKA